MRKLIATLLLVLLPTLALGQSFPLTMPGQTVYGRLGIAGQSGPGQAIPMANLLSALNGVAWGGKARMVPHVGQTSSSSDCYTLTDPYGNAIACTTSTTTQGLQEFLTAATSNGWPAEVVCQGVKFPSGTEPIYINATTSVTVPVAQDWSFRSYGCNLNSSVATVPALIIDSNGATHFDWDGKIVYNVSSPNGDVTTNPSCAVYINPTTNTQDGFAGLYDGYFRIKSISVIATGGTATANVCANTNTGGVHQVVEFQELQSVGAVYYGFMSFGTHGVQGSRVTIDHPHGMTSAGVKLNTAISGGNLWTLNNIAPDGASAKGVWTFTSNDDFRIGTITNSDGAYAYGMYTDGASANNVFRFYSVVSAGTANWLNNSSGSNYFIGQSGIVGYQTGPQNWFAQFVGLGSGAGESSAFVSQSTAPSYAWQTTGAAANSKWWDCLTGSATFQCRTVNDAQSVANAWLQVTRSGTSISSVQIGNGTTFATVPISKNDTLVGSAAWAPLASNIGAL